MQYRPDIDGLRALAVLVVILFHADQGCGGGFVGVDVFFVISGYLITGILGKSRSGFWVRRIRRIVPALAATVGVTLAAGALLLLPSDLVLLAQSALAQCALASNFYFWQHTGYFEGPAELQPLLHTWSLAVEEQFYLLYPPLLYLLRNRLASAFVISLGAGIYFTQQHPSAAFYLLPTRAWELLLGGLLAQRKPPNRPRELLAALGLAAILAAVLLFSPRTPFPGVAALLPCVGTALVIWANTPGLTLTGKLLASRPAVALGRVSYSWYLWHWPLFVYVRYWSPGTVPSATRWLLVGISLLLAAASYRWIETPCRQARLKPLALVWLALLSTSALLIHLKGLPGRFPAQILRFADTKNNEPEWIPQVGVQAARRGEFPPLGLRDPAAPIDFLLWGDSHALAMAPTFDELGREFHKRGVAATHSGTLPLLGYESHGAFALKADSVPYNAAVLDFVHKHKVPNVILVARWTNYPTDGLSACLQRTLAELDRAGATAWLLLQVPEHQVMVPRALARAVLLGTDPDQIGCTLEEHRARTEAFLQHLRKAKSTHILDATPLFFQQRTRARVADHDSALYWDDNHLTLHGGRFLRPLLTPIYR